MFYICCMKKIDNNTNMFLFARWISICYADEHLDDKMRYTDNIDFDKTKSMSVLNRETGEWYKEQLKHFNKIVLPNYLKNGTFKDSKEFLKDI